MGGAAELQSGMSIGWALPNTKIDLKCKATFVFPGLIPFLSGSSEGIVSTFAIKRLCLYASLSLTLAVEKSVYLKIFSCVFCMLINFHHLQIYLQTKNIVLFIFTLSLSFCTVILSEFFLHPSLIRRRRKKYISSHLVASPFCHSTGKMSSHGHDNHIQL